MSDASEPDERRETIDAEDHVEGTSPPDPPEGGVG